MEEIVFEARDGKKIVCHQWLNVQAPKAIVQIIHGMKEYGARYDRFARFMNQNGYIVFADDHRSHGKTAVSVDMIGKVEKEKDLFMSTVQDELDITVMLKEKYNLPVFVFGHSYGSFLSQKYMQLSHMHQAVCISGSAKMPRLLLIFGTLVARLGCIFLSENNPAKLIEKLTFGKYGRKIKDGTIWITRDKAEGDKYEKDPYTQNLFSNGFYDSFFNNLRKLHRKKGLNAIDKDIPLMIISGEQDGVGGYGKYSTALYHLYRELGMKKLFFKLYPNARHELLNEINYHEVQNDILDFFEGGFQ